MAKPRLSVGVPVLTALLLAVLQAGCATYAAPGAGEDVIASFDLPPLACDTSAKFIPLATRLRNDTGGDIVFYLEGDHPPPYDPWYMGYRVHSGPPGGQFTLVHNSGHDSVWNRQVTIHPGEAVDFNVPLFGLRPSDYRRWHRIELRDSRNRSYWTAPFSLCGLPRGACGCPPPGGVAVGLQAPSQTCPVTAAGDRCP